MLASKLAGQSTSAIGRAEGLTRGWVAHELESGDCQQVILGLVKRDFQRIERLWNLTLDVIEEGYSAQKTAMYLGEPVDLGADHFARLTASRRFLDVVSLGRPTAKGADVDPGKKGHISLPDLIALVDYQNQTEKKPAAKK